MSMECLCKGGLLCGKCYVFFKGFGIGYGVVMRGDNKSKLRGD